MSNSRAARRKLARQDGKVIKIAACCHLEVTLGPTTIKVGHEDGCPALHPDTPAGLAARAAANLAITQALRRTIGFSALAVMLP